MVVNIDLSSTQTTAFENKANSSIIPIIGVDAAGHDIISKAINEIPSDIEFQNFQGMFELAAVFWSEKEKNSYWVKIPYDRLTSEWFIIYTINGEKYRVKYYNIHKLSEYMHYSDDVIIYMNRKAEKNYNRCDVVGGHKKINQHQFMKFFDSYAPYGFQYRDNPWVFVYIFEEI